MLAALTATLVLASVGSGGTGKSQVSPLPASSCSAVKGSKSAKFLIASDLPLQGSGRSQTLEMQKAIAFILNGAGWKAGSYTVAYQSCDDATAQAGNWESVQCYTNGNTQARRTD